VEEEQWVTNFLKKGWGRGQQSEKLVNWRHKAKNGTTEKAGATQNSDASCRKE